MPSRITAGLAASTQSLAAPGAVAALGCLGCGVVLWADPTAAGNPLPTCPTKALLGIDCAGCGSLRMLYSLLHGDVAAAAQYNAVGLVAVPLLVWAWTAWAISRRTGRVVPSWQRWRWAPLTTVIVVVAWTVLRNLPFAPFTGLYV